MSAASTYLWAVLIIAAAVAIGAFFVQRAWAVKGPPRPTVGPGKKFVRSLEDMRLKGIATPEELSAETEAAEDLAAPPPSIPGLPQTPADMRPGPHPSARRGPGEDPGTSARGSHRRRRSHGDHWGQGK